jgi:hypothetical protein
MGLIRLLSCDRSNNQSKSHATIQNPNPDPYHYHIIKEEVVNGKSILLVRYYGCTTFDGKKLLLLKTKWRSSKIKLSELELDPHLLGEDHIVAARFEPNKNGWKLARACANLL